MIAQDIGYGKGVVEAVIAYVGKGGDDSDALFPQRAGAGKAVEYGAVGVHEVFSDNLWRREVYQVPVVHITQMRKIEIDAAPLQFPVGSGMGELLNEHEQCGKTYLVIFRRDAFLKIGETCASPAFPHYLPGHGNLDAEEPVPFPILTRPCAEEARKPWHLLRIPRLHHQGIQYVGCFRHEIQSRRDKENN